MRVAIAGCTVTFGAVRALWQVDMTIASGERRAIIGPNGAGKSTLFNAVAGDLHPAAGSIRLGDRDATRLDSWRRANLGLARTFQRSALFPQLSVEENLALAVRRRRGCAWQLWGGRQESDVRAEVESRLDAAGLRRLARRQSATLGHGEQRAIEIELALAAEPRLLLLDEPMAGLSGEERHQAVERLDALPRQVTIVIVEHDLDAVFALAERISVLDHGIKIADGSPEEIRADPRVQEVYLGVA